MFHSFSIYVWFVCIRPWTISTSEKWVSGSPKRIVSNPHPQLEIVGSSIAVDSTVLVGWLNGTLLTHLLRVQSQISSFWVDMENNLLIVALKEQHNCHRTMVSDGPLLRCPHKLQTPLGGNSDGRQRWSRIIRVKVGGVGLLDCVLIRSGLNSKNSRNEPPPTRFTFKAHIHQASRVGIAALITGAGAVMHSTDALAVSWGKSRGCRKRKRTNVKKQTPVQIGDSIDSGFILGMKNLNAVVRCMKWTLTEQSRSSSFCVATNFTSLYCIWLYWKRLWLKSLQNVGPVDHSKRILALTWGNTFNLAKSWVHCVNKVFSYLFVHTRYAAVGALLFSIYYVLLPTVLLCLRSGQSITFSPTLFIHKLQFAAYFGT